MEPEETEVEAPEPIEDECPTFEAVGVSYAAAVDAMIQASELCVADEHEKVLIVPVEHVEDSHSTVEAVNASHAAVETGVNPLSFQHHEHEDATVEDVAVVEDVAAVEDVIAIEDAAIIEDVITVEDVVAVEDVAAVEDVITVEDVVAVEDVAVEGVTTVGDITAIQDAIVEDVTTDEDVTADEDKILPSVLVPLVREKAVKRSTRALSEILIRGCEGIGPVIWKGLVAFLMEPWMIDREVPTQIRKLSRIIIPKKRMRKKKSPIFWSYSPFSCQPTDLDGVASIWTFTKDARNRFEPRSGYLQTP
ncbi:hypothetical protein E4U37_003045 [Claviceps purpurea]|nr:hypothetical protein E4U37_003045 [Claviceps purpurea]